ncbi:hypothetical protein [Leifsonia xyli]
MTSPASLFGIHATVRMPPTVLSSIPMKKPPRFTPTSEYTATASAITP